jgi:hypothetical protein
LPKGKSKRKYPALYKQKIPSRKGQHIDMAEDISHDIELAYLKIRSSKQLINEAWDLINSVPKRVP